MQTVKPDSTAKLNKSPALGARRALLRGVIALSLVASAPYASALRSKPVVRPTTILVLGDSLSAEYGLARGTGWVALLVQRLASRKDVNIVNASISGETTSGGLTRLPQLLQQYRPSHVVLELGANDALRGLPIKATQANLTSMARQSRMTGAKVVLVGMALPPNFGKRYAQDFEAIYPAVAQAESTALVPFLLKGIADRADAREWFQADGIHPIAKAHPTLLNNVWQALGPTL